MWHRLQSAYTLIELLIVIAIIGVLTSVLVVAINPAGQLMRGRDAKRKADIQQLQSLLEEYRQSAGQYPPPVSGNQLNADCSGSSALKYTDSNGNVITYATKIACDPLVNSIGYNNGNYYYTYDNVTGNYSMAACLESKADTEGKPCPGSSAASCVSALCYVVTNP